MDQPLQDALDIREVARRTGLTSRALRFYEARGLLAPLRTYNGRRFYGPGELERIQQIVALKRAGMTLSQIAKLVGRTQFDLGALVDTQLKLINERKAELDEARALLLSIKSRIDRGEPVDAATFCSLIRNGESIMEAQDWKTITDRYFTPEEQAAFKARMADAPPGFDQEAYGRKWKELSARIEAALPLDSRSDEAQAFVDEWFALLKPFSQVATPEMWKGVAHMYGDMENWPAKVDAGFSKQVWDLIRKATQARIADGGTIDGPAWMTGSKPA